MTCCICLCLVCLCCLHCLVFLTFFMDTWSSSEEEPWIFLRWPMPALCFLGNADTCLVLANFYCFSCLVLKWSFMAPRKSCSYYNYSSCSSYNEISLSLFSNPIYSYMSRWESRGRALRVTSIALCILQSTVHSSVLKQSFLDIPSTGLFNHCSVP